MTRRQKIFGVMGALLLTTVNGTAWAATYYVATNGSDSNPGSEAKPYKTIQKGADVAKAGDTVIVMPGTYIGAIANKNDGTASARIRFVSKERWGAKVASPTTPILWRSIGDYVDIEGFEVTGHTGGSSKTYMGIIAYGTGSRIMYNHVHNIRTTECNRGIGIDTSSYDTNFGTEIIGNLIHDIGGHGGQQCKDLPGLSSTLDRGYGIYLATQFGKVQNNIIYNCGAYGIHLWHKPDNSIISHNLIFNSRIGMTIGAGDSPFTGTGDGIIVSNNIVMNSELYAIRQFGKIGSNSRFINNITYKNGTNEITHPKRALPSSMVFGNLIGVDPKLANLAGGDYKLSAGSPAIDSGATQCNSFVQNCVPTEDHWQGSRPINSKYDIGPHEYGSTPKSAPPLIPPGGTGGASTAGCSTAPSSPSPATPSAPINVPAGPGKTYYVATNGSDSNAGTQAAPFKTIQKGADVAKAGDTVIVMPGTYNESVKQRNHGTESARIRLVSKDRWGARIVTSDSHAVDIFGTYVDVEGFEVTKSSRYGIVLYGSHTRALYNHVYNISSPDCSRFGSVGILTSDYTSSNQEIIGNVVHHIGREPFCNRSPGIYASTMKTRVLNNITYQNSSAGIALNHAPVENIIAHNLSFSNLGSGVVFGCGDAPNATCDRIMVYNNIFMYNNTAIRETNRGKNNPTNIVSNNITYKNKNDTPVMLLGTASNNFIGVNPQLKNFNPAGSSRIEDYYPALGSPAIDKASTACAGCNINSDILLGARPSGAGSDIGPLEAGSKPNAVPPPIAGSAGIGGSGGSSGDCGPFGFGPLLSPKGEVCPAGFLP